MVRMCSTTKYKNISPVDLTDEFFDQEKRLNKSTAYLQFILK